MLAGQYHTNRLAVAGGNTWAWSYAAHKKTQRVSLGVIRSEDQYGTGPSIYCLADVTLIASYEWMSIGESSSIISWTFSVTAFI